MPALAPQEEPDPEGMDDHSFQDPCFTSELKEVQSWDRLAKGPRLKQGASPEPELLEEGQSASRKRGLGGWS